MDLQSYENAKTLFSHVIGTYEPTPLTPVSTSLPPATDSEPLRFLASIAKVGPHSTPSTSSLPSEYERYVVRREGGDAELAIEDLLLWWKVSFDMLSLK